MNLVRMVSMFLASLLGATAANSQPPLPPNCMTPEHSQFDFWVGTWTVRWINADKTTGSGANRVRRIHDGCVIVEEFDGTPGTSLKGTSMSVFDRQSKTWRQTWVDNTGAYLAFEGGWEGEGSGGRMTLVRRAVVNGKPVMNRMVFRDITNSTIVWDWQRLNDDGATWTTTWQIRYERRE
jgi:hypothetical protein